MNKIYLCPDLKLFLMQQKLKQLEELVMDKLWSKQMTELELDELIKDSVIKFLNRLETTKR